MVSVLAERCVAQGVLVVLWGWAGGLGGWLHVNARVYGLVGLGVGHCLRRRSFGLVVASFVEVCLHLSASRSLLRSLDRPLVFVRLIVRHRSCGLGWLLCG